MGRRRKSTAEHELSGSFEKHPERKAARAHEPKPEGPLGGPPVYFLQVPCCRYCSCEFGACATLIGGRCVPYAGRPDVCSAPACLEAYRVDDRYSKPTVDYVEAARLRGIWFELIEQVPAGILTVADRFHVELTCRLLDRVRNSEAKSGDYSRLDVLLGKMGMNPADRSRVNVVPGSPGVGSKADGDTAGNHGGSGGNTFQQIRKEASANRPN